MACTIPAVLGMKGSISEFELGVLRSRMLDLLVPRRGAVNCVSPCQSAIRGIAKLVSALIPTCAFRNSSA